MDAWTTVVVKHFQLVNMDTNQYPWCSSKWSYRICTVPLLKDQTDVLTIVDASRYSHLNCLLATIAYIYRFIHVSYNPNFLELLLAQSYLMQGDVWSLLYNTVVILKNLLTQDILQVSSNNLRLFIDDKKFIRCSGWIHIMHQQQISFSTSFPRSIRLPKWL